MVLAPFEAGTRQLPRLLHGAGRFRFPNPPNPLDSPAWSSRGTSPMRTSRRQILLHLAATGGWAVALGASQAMGMSLTDTPKIEKPDLAPGSGKGKRVLILGGGIAGLVSAYELGKAGYT